jgi:CheY-like chemotaxis protein
MNLPPLLVVDDEKNMRLSLEAILSDEGYQFRAAESAEDALRLLNQEQFFVGFNSRLNPRISLFSNYSLSYSRNNTDGQGSASFSANPYDMHGEYGRGGFDIRHRMFLGGSLNLPWWQVTLNPLIFATSGAPFNMITGADTNLDGQFGQAL